MQALIWFVLVAILSLVPLCLFGESFRTFQEYDKVTQQNDMVQAEVATKVGSELAEKFLRPEGELAVVAIKFAVKKALGSEEYKVVEGYLEKYFGQENKKKLDELYLDKLKAVA